MSRVGGFNIKMSEIKLPCFPCPRHFPKANGADVVVCTKLGCGHCWKSEGVESESHTNIKYNGNIFSVILYMYNRYGFKRFMKDLFTEDSNFLSLSRQVTSISLAFKQDVLVTLGLSLKECT